MAPLSLLSTGGAAYAGARAINVAVQLAFSVLLTRVLSEGDLGRFAIGWSIASLLSMWLGLSVRRLTMHRAKAADLTDLKYLILSGGLASLLLALLIGWSFDWRTGLISVGIALWRAADAYSEIGQGAYCLDDRMVRGGVAVLLRVGISTILGASLVIVWDVVPALLIAGVLRLGFALGETELSRPQAWSSPVRETLWVGFRYGTYLSTVGAIILLIDVAPTIVIGHFGGLSEAALLTPLGRVRFGLTIVATTLAEIAYASMVRNRHAPDEVLRTTLRPIREYIAVTLLIAAVCSIGVVEMIFGDVLQGQRSAVLWAVGAGAALGMATIISTGLTAIDRIAIQLVGYSLAAVIATAGTIIGGWHVRAMYQSQIAGCLLALVLFVLMGYKRSPDAHYHSPEQTA